MTPCSLKHLFTMLSYRRIKKKITPFPSGSVYCMRHLAGMPGMGENGKRKNPPDHFITDDLYEVYFSSNVTGGRFDIWHNPFHTWRPPFMTNTVHYLYQLSLIHVKWILYLNVFVYKLRDPRWNFIWYSKWIKCWTANHQHFIKSKFYHRNETILKIKGVGDSAHIRRVETKKKYNNFK